MTEEHRWHAVVDIKGGAISSYIRVKAPDCAEAEDRAITKAYKRNKDNPARIQYERDDCEVTYLCRADTTWEDLINAGP